MISTLRRGLLVLLAALPLMANAAPAFCARSGAGHHQQDVG